MNPLTKYLVYLSSLEGYGRKKIFLEYQKYKKKQPPKVSSEIFETIHDSNIEVIPFFDQRYPKQLKEIYDFPILLFCLGNTNLLSNTCVTVVGTREMTQYGEKVLDKLLNINNPDVNIVSGLARGVDAQVHKLCLQRDINTIAVVAGGLYKGYPKSNQSIFEEISKKGLVISEFPPNREVVKGMFPLRNRILAGLCTSTVVVESCKSGGSLITAQLALEYNRDVYAVPGEIFRKTSQGCNNLIEQGATPLSEEICWEDILNLKIS